MTVTGIDDSIIDGSQVTTVTLSIDDVNSDDTFDPLADQTVMPEGIDCFLSLSPRKCHHLGPPKTKLQGRLVGGIATAPNAQQAMMKRRVEINTPALLGIKMLRRSIIWMIRRWGTKC